jgi:4-hydroxybenzoate polyprenyltransferase
VLLWVTGFDIIYALQDIEFDKQNNLKSVPVVIGIKNALILSALLHMLSALLLIAIGIVAEFGFLYWIGTSVFLLLLFYQHFIVKPSDMSRINLAFFSLNGIASVIFGIFTIAEIVKEFLFV